MQSKKQKSEAPQSFAVMKDLTDRGEDISHTVQRLGDLLAPAGFSATLQLCLRDADTSKPSSCFQLKLAQGKVTVSTKSSKKPDIELIMRPETWLQIAAGKLPPHQVFLTGGMRLRGNADLAQKMLKHLAAGPGQTHLCLGV
jgi:hypothetical protein